MKLRLSAKATEQLYGEKPSEKVEDPKNREKDDARRARVAEKAARKKAKVDARDTAYAADAALQATMNDVLQIEETIQKSENRLEKDRDDHRIRIERSQGRLQNLQRQLEKIHQEMEQARVELETVREDVPKSISRMGDFKRELGLKITDLQKTFTDCEDAWSNPLVTNSARTRKRNKNLRREAKKRL